MCWKPSELSMPSSMPWVFFCASLDERDVGALADEQRLAAGQERRQQRGAFGQVDHDLERAAGRLVAAGLGDGLQDVLLVVLLIALSVMFGGFQKGTQAKGLGYRAGTAAGLVRT
jgi:hypothetical protein